MEKIIQQLTEKFYRQLPKADFYKLGNFNSYDFPDFLIQHLRYRLHTKVKKQLELPSPQWVNFEANEVQQTKHHFLNALFDEARLPAASARDFINKSISNILKILVQPRQNIPDILFGDKAELTTEQVEERVQLITVYPHFGQVLTGYLIRKQRDKLTKEQCQTIISNVDEKLTQNYLPEQWATLLNPLFILTDNQADSSLFQLFFKDKQMPAATNVFSQEQEKFGRDEFIETLASIDSTKTNEAPDEAPEKPTKKTKFNPPSPVVENSEQRTESEANKTVTEPGLSVNTKYSESENQEKSLNDFFAQEQDEENDEVKQTALNLEASEAKPKVNSQEENKNIPMWKRFADNDKTEETVEKETKSTQPKENSDSTTELKKYLVNRQQLFIDELFSGSVDNYEKSIAEIAKKRTWQETVHTIQNDIFEKNSVDIYSPAAVEFTDRLQEYFAQK